MFWTFQTLIFLFFLFVQIHDRVVEMDSITDKQKSVITERIGVRFCVAHPTTYLTFL